MATYITKMGEFKWLETDTLMLDNSASGFQRDNETQAKKIIKEGWIWQLAGCLTVFHRQRSGQLSVVDGGGRLKAAIKLDIEKLPCMVYISSGPQEEAYWFGRLNHDRTRISPSQDHKAKVRAKDPVAIFVQELIEHAEEGGVKVGKSIATLVREAKTESGRKTLSIMWPMIVEVWKGHALTSGTIKGLMHIAEVSNEPVNMLQYIGKLNPVSVTESLKGLPDRRVEYGRVMCVNFDLTKT